jgi:outer membrane protein assembly factor BamB
MFYITDFLREYYRWFLLPFIFFLFIPVLAASGVSPGETPLETPRLKWIFGDVNRIYSQKISPVVGPDGTVYFGSDDDGLFAVRPDGTLKWKREGLRSDNAPAVDADGTVYYGSHSRLYAFSSDGSDKWNTPVNIGDYSSPAIGYRGDVYIGSSDGFLYAFNSQGELRWRHRTGQIRASPTVGPDGTVYVASTDGNIYAVTPWGTRKWLFGGIHGLAFTAPGLGLEGTIYYWSVYNVFHAINPDGKMRWGIPLKSPMYSTPAVAADGTIYVGSYTVTGDVYAINPDGSVKWRFQGVHYISSSPAIGSDGTVYIGCNGGYVYALNPDGILKWKFQTNCVTETSPAISPDGTVYVGAKVLYAFQTESYGYQPGSPWPGLSYPTRSMVDNGRVVMPKLHTVRGRVAMPDSTPLIDVDIAIDGLTVMSDANGYFSFDLPDGNYTMTLDVISTAIPNSVPVTVNGADVLVTLSEPEKHVVRGRLLARSGPIAGLKVSAADQTTITDREGWYSFLLPVGKYTLAFDVGEDYFPSSKDIEISNADILIEDMYLNHIIWRYTSAGTVDNLPPALDTDGCSYLLVHLRRSVQLQEVGPNGVNRRYFEIDSPNPHFFTRGKDGTFYIQNGDEMIALNTDLTLKWKYTITDPESGISREPAIGPDGTIYFGTIGKMVYALYPDGSFRWKYPFSDRLEIVPAIGSYGTVYVPSHDGKLYAFKADGTLKWTYPTGGIILDTPQIGKDGVLYFGSCDNFLYAVNPDGSLKWRYDSGSAIRNEAVLGTDGTIYIINELGELTALNQDGTLRWKRSEAHATIRNLWIYPPTGEIWVRSWSAFGDSITALKPTGEVKWREPAEWSFPSCMPDGKIRMTVTSETSPQTGYLWEVEMGEYEQHPEVVESERPASELISLFPNRPNPFNPSTTISFTLSAPGKSHLVVYDITGRKVRELVSRILSAGAYSVVWDGRDDAGRAVSSGVYLSRLESGGKAATGKMLLMK